MEQTLGKRIAENRKRMKLTQDQLAERLGITAQAVSKWENDQSCPDIAMLPKLAEIFGISTDELLGRSTGKTYEAEVIEEQENDGIHLQKGNWEFRWDSGRRDAVGFAVAVLAVGILYLLSQVMNWQLSLWEILWPTAILMFGIWGLGENLSFFRLGCVLFGGYSLASKIFQFQFDGDGKMIWAILIIVFGISLLADAVKKAKKPKFSVHIPSGKKMRHDYTCDADSFTYSASFGEYTQAVRLARLSEGEVSVSFGDYCIDLTEVEEVTSGCEIDAACSFGELRFIVPKRYRIIAEQSTAFGALDVQGAPDDTPAGEIHLTGGVSFGEISIKYV